MSEIIAYKAFNEGLANRYGDRFELGEVYQAFGEIKWGVNGFHMCIFPENCFRYFDDDVLLALVRGFGNMQCYDDEYNGYYDMYVCEKMEILKVISHDEIIEMALGLKGYRLENFLKTFKLDLEEIEVFKCVYYNNPRVLDFISYYQENNKDAFVKKRGKYYG